MMPYLAWLQSHKIWLSLVLLRFCLVFLPQQGYIHPDEFFQNTEVVAGDVLNISVLRSWEFSAGLRSVPPIYFQSGPPFYLMKGIPLLRTSCWAVVLPRLNACLLSLVVDFVVACVCGLSSLESKTVLPILASSYIMLTYLTRTFSNSIETVVFSLLLLLVMKVVKDIQANKEFKETQKEQHDRYQRMSLEEFRNKHNTKSVGCKHITNISSMTFFWIGFLSAIGLFDRPTFAAFSVGPVLWLIMTVVIAGDGLMSCFTFMTFGAVLPSLVMVLIDTQYYSGKTVVDILSRFRQCVVTSENVAECWEDFFKLFVVTPLNFIKYNTDPNNLSSHGRHPLYTHLVVNLLILFGPFVVLMLVEVKRLLLRQSTSPRHVLLCFVMVPVFILSMFPHQEPRFLLPILPVVILLCASTLHCVRYRYLFFSVWSIFNITCTFFYGVFHQGGVIPLLSYIEKHTHNPHAVFTHQDQFLFFHTYMPPRSLLLSNSSLEQITDLQGSSMQKLVESIRTRHNDDSYVVLPGTLMEEFSQQNISFVVTKMFPLHLSMEDPPPLRVVRDFWENFTGTSRKLSDLLSLYLIKSKS
ncbi:GPI mannosyltransferase 4-like [Saccostrea echinata]|uniref:GPI mannosyltransferase 4-like n=1 Tax=Saccostrea echinata TaxID=191078 RepID=UPI002A8273D5|nr:GPI mannosyltransferase 4-like [Saccostrea echinata]